MVTQKELKGMLLYRPDKGDFIWRACSANSIKANRAAGCKDTYGYIRVSINNKIYAGHRLAWLYMTGSWPKQVDHINHKKDDNRWCNLRETTQTENTKNQVTRKNNTSGVTGANWHKTKKKWQANICAKRKSIHLGYFDDKFEAICARMSANNKYGFHENHGR